MKLYEPLTGGSRGVNGPTGQSQPKQGRSLTGHRSTTARIPAKGVAPTCSAHCPAPRGVENDPLATEEEVAVGNGVCGGAAQGTPAKSGHGGPT